MLRIEKTDALADAQKKVLLDLWQKEYPVQLGYAGMDDFDVYLAGLEQLQHYLLLDGGNEISGWAFRFQRYGEP